ncbi:dTDP-4-amino-4,6-dideoxygalactose transaminase [Bradyrhizobium sp. SBR1B]|nr:dTDP-4-amino-4,6-dideoxygalactose transaminase [Bradyrhizobium sp. SBR1B]
MSPFHGSTAQQQIKSEIDIPIALPLLGEGEANAAREAVLSGWVSRGPQVAVLEREFAAVVGAPHACAVSNCTTALHLALMTVNVGPGDEVITTSHSFIATANSIRCCGATPVLVDIDPETYNIDPACAAEAITPRTRAILAVQMGMPCDLRALVSLAKRHGILLIQDSACAAGSQIHIDGRWDPTAASMEVLVNSPTRGLQVGNIGHQRSDGRLIARS